MTSSNNWNKQAAAAAQGHQCRAVCYTTGMTATTLLYHGSIVTATCWGCGCIWMQTVIAHCGSSSSSEAV